MKNEKYRIGLDIRPLETGNKYRGFGYYVFHLVKNLLAIDQNNNYVLFLSNRQGNPLVEELSHYSNCQFVTISRPRIKPRLWWWPDLWLLPAVIKSSRLNLFHSLDFNAPRRALCPIIVTIHDMIPYMMGQEYCWPIDRRAELFFKKRFAFRADKIITDSRYSQSDIQRLATDQRMDISVIPLAVDESFQPISVTEQQSIRQQYTNGQKFLITIGDFYGHDPRKKYDHLITTFAELTKLPEYNDYQLLLVGQHGGRHNDYQKITKQIKELGLSPRIKFTGFVEYNILPKILASAAALVYPSIYEGFGLPPLQAMACGTPVVAYNCTSVPEVVGQAAFLVEPTDQALLAGIKQVLSPQEQRRLSAIGQNQAKKFSWKKAAVETLRIYEETINRSGQ